jgi:hypothetical protein
MVVKRLGSNVLCSSPDAPFSADRFLEPWVREPAGSWQIQPLASAVGGIELKAMA